MDGNFRFQAKKAFLTYSRCPLPKEVWFEEFKRLFPDNELRYYAVAQETHKDGGLHLHALIEFENKVTSRLASVFDVYGYHPNVKTIKNAAGWTNRLTYMQKEDAHMLTNIEKTVSKRDQIMLDLIEQGTLTPQFVRQNPSIMYQNFQNIRNWLNFVNPGHIPIRILPKKRHVWLTGPSNSGKSYRLNLVMQLYLSPAEIPSNNDYSGIDHKTDFLYYDEFKGQLTVQQLNKLCDGRCHLNTKGGSTMVGYPTIWIVSNYDIRSCYPGISDDLYLTLTNRFDQYVAPIFPKFPSHEL